MADVDAAQVEPCGNVADYACLVGGLQKGDPAACAALCQQFGPRIYRLAAGRLSGDGQAAEDMMIQTLADAVRNIGRYNPRRSTFAAWLYGIARRQIQLEFRRRRRLKSVPAAAQIPVEAIAEVPDGRDVAENLAARLDAQGQVAAVASVLSDIEFEVLSLNCIDELSAREIGRIVHRSERAIHSLLYRARQKARRRLMQNEDRAD